MNHLLILGAPRSGTSLLSSLLAKHDDIAVLYEDYGDSISKIIAKKYAANKLCIPNQIQLSTRRHKIRSMFFNFILRYQPFRSLLRNYRYPLSYMSIEDYLQLEGIKIVAIVRDGNDVVSSIMKRGINKDFHDASKWWVKAIETLYTVWENNKNNVFLVTFDDMVSDSECVVKKLAEFLDVKYQEEMLEGYKYTPVYTGSSGIDASKARKKKSDAVDYKIKEKFPDAYNKYLKLNDAASS